MRDKYTELVKKYPELYSDPKQGEKGPKHSMFMFGFETPNGWYPLLERMSKEISDLVKGKEEFNNFRFHQVKSKFAELSAFPNMRDENIVKIIKKYEAEASETCEACGSKENVKTRHGTWLFKLCLKCFDAKSNNNKDLRKV